MTAAFHGLPGAHYAAHGRERFHKRASAFVGSAAGSHRLGLLLEREESPAP